MNAILNTTVIIVALTFFLQSTLHAENAAEQNIGETEYTNNVIKF